MLNRMSDPIERMDSSGENPEVLLMRSEDELGRAREHDATVLFDGFLWLDEPVRFSRFAGR